MSGSVLDGRRDSTEPLTLLRGSDTLPFGEDTLRLRKLADNPLQTKM